MVAEDELKSSGVHRYLVDSGLAIVGAGVSMSVWFVIVDSGSNRVEVANIEVVGT
jgi:hypothetical protein